MKKYVILAIIIVLSISSIAYLYTKYKSDILQAESNNKMYIEIYNKEISGAEFASIINKTLDRNEKNKVQKNENGIYISNDTNSISIEIKFKDSEEIFKVEQISKNGIENFIKLYSNFKFKCTKIEYHEKTKYIKYLYFEEI